MDQQVWKCRFTSLRIELLHIFTSSHFLCTQTWLFAVVVFFGLHTFCKWGLNSFCNQVFTHLLDCIPSKTIIYCTQKRKKRFPGNSDDLSSLFKPFGTEMFQTFLSVKMERARRAPPTRTGINQGGAYTNREYISACLNPKVGCVAVFMRSWLQRQFYFFFLEKKLFWNIYAHREMWVP